MFESIRSRLSAALVAGAALLSGCGGAEPTPESRAIASDQLSRQREGVAEQAADVGGQLDLMKLYFGGMSDARDNAEILLSFGRSEVFEKNLERVKQEYLKLGKEIAQLDSAYAHLSREARALSEKDSQKPEKSQ